MSISKEAMSNTLLTNQLNASLTVQKLIESGKKMCAIVEGKFESDESILFDEEIDDYIEMCNLVGIKPNRQIVDKIDSLPY